MPLQPQQFTIVAIEGDVLEAALKQANLGEEAEMLVWDRFAQGLRPALALLETLRAEQAEQAEQN